MSALSTAACLEKWLTARARAFRRRATKKHIHDCGEQDGVVLVVVVVMIGVLSFIAGTVFTSLRPEIKGAGYFRNQRVAFYNAEAGVQYLIDQLSSDIASGAIELDGTDKTVSYSAPGGYDFDTVTDLKALADGMSYAAAVTGRCSSARAVIEVGFRQPTMLMAGAFGNVELQLQPNIELYSYDSRVTSSPTPANSTGKANAGSNGNIIVRPGVVLDGVFMLGEDELGFSPSPISGYENQSVGRIPTDPLGANGGAVEDANSYYSDPANNDNAAAGISANKLSLKNGDTVTLASGHYYLDSIALASGSTLNIAGSPSDPVVIFLNGPMEAKPNSSIVTSSGKPTELYIFSVASDDIKLYPNNNFDGMIYAPNAYLDLHPNNRTKGIFFANDMLILPGAESFIDTALLSEFRAPYVEVFQWRNVLD